MFDTLIKCISTIYVIRLVLNHNLFIHHLKIKIKFLGLDIEVKSKEKVNGVGVFCDCSLVRI